MSVTLTRDLRLKASEDSTRILADRTLQTSVTVTGANQETRTIAPGGGSVSLDLAGASTLKSLHIEADGALDVVLNGADTAVPLRPIGTAKGVLYIEGAITSVSVSNPSSSTSVAATIFTTS